MFRAILYIYDEDGTLDGIPELLEALPHNIEDLYSTMLQRFTKGEDEKLERAKRVFQWILCSQRPLTIPELEEAISISLGQKSWRTPSLKLDASRLSKLCGNLIKYDKTDNTVSLAHHTVYNFLQSNSGNNSRILIEETESEQYLAQICLTYLSFADFQKALTRTLDAAQLVPTKQPLTFMEKALPGPLRPFARYAREQKMKGNPSFDITSALRNELNAYQRSNANTNFELLEYCKSHWTVHSRHLDLEDPRHEVALRNITLRSHPWKEVLPWSTFDTKEPLPLWNMFQWTVYNGHKNLYKLWQDLRHRPEIEYWKHIWDDEFLHKFRAALWSLHFDQVDIMLHAQNKMYSHYLGPDDQLLDTGDHEYVNRKRPPMPIGPVVKSELLKDFVRACRDGNDLVMERLLQEEIQDIISTDIDSGEGPYSPSSALQTAARYGHVTIVKELISGLELPNYSIPGVNKIAALRAAAGNGHLAVLELLVRAGVNPSRHNHVLPGRSPLRAASEGGHLECVKRLLQAGAEVNISDSSYDTTSALYGAVVAGQEMAVQLLLSQGAKLALGEPRGNLRRLLLLSIIRRKGILYNSEPRMREWWRPLYRLEHHQTVT